MNSEFVLTLSCPERPGILRLVTAGRDAGRLAPARAVNWHCQGRVLLHGNRTVVFS